MGTSRKHDVKINKCRIGAPQKSRGNPEIPRKSHGSPTGTPRNHSGNSEVLHKAHGTSMVLRSAFNETCVGSLWYFLAIHRLRSAFMRLAWDLYGTSERYIVLASLDTAS